MPISQGEDESEWDIWDDDESPCKNILAGGLDKLSQLDSAKNKLATSIFDDYTRATTSIAGNIEQPENSNGNIHRSDFTDFREVAYRSSNVALYDWVFIVLNKERLSDECNINTYPGLESERVCIARSRLSILY